MVFLRKLIGAVALLAPLPVIEESVRRLEPLPLAGPSLEMYTLVTVPVPARPPQQAHYRLRVNSAARSAWLDGARLTPNEDGDFDLLNLNPKASSRVVLPGWVEDAVLVETPRVFVTRHEIVEPNARLWVRNSLENTVNVYLQVTGAPGHGGILEASATVPPGYTQIVPLSGLSGIPDGPWRITLEKQEEAMEGGYRFVKTVERRTGPTVNSYVKP